MMDVQACSPMPTIQQEQRRFSAGASFRIAGTDMDFESITREMGQEPTHFHRQGELGELKEPYPTDVWLLSSPLGPAESLDAHLSWLASVLLPRKEYISKLRETNKLDIYCFKACYTEQASLLISSQTLRIFTELNFAFGVSLIFLPDGPD
jgi:hypothetical protein